MSFHGREDEIRATEIAALRPLFAGATRVLEVGAGSGLQASIVSSWGYDVAAVDLPDRERAAQHFTVVEYDGVNLPFPDDTFDVVYSSSVLEHVEDLPALLDELARVTRAGGISLHTVPTPVWRGWTIVTHPIDPWKYLWRRLRHAEGNLVRAVAGDGPRDPMRRRMRRLAVAPVHGEYPSLRAEMHAYRESQWHRRLSECGYSVERVIPNQLFHTGVGVLPFVGMHGRHRIARALGSPVKTFVCRPRP